mmetsp:Transcript_6020/g.26992  ORF Transcript_6020/g.26992 Transcript_6020/m.26992 type:complete len:222 (-) Transcript_6020:3833-4498(-)
MFRLLELGTLGLLEIPRVANRSPFLLHFVQLTLGELQTKLHLLLLAEALSLERVLLAVFPERVVFRGPVQLVELLLVLLVLRLGVQRDLLPELGLNLELVQVHIQQFLTKGLEHVPKLSVVLEEDAQLSLVIGVGRIQRSDGVQGHPVRQHGLGAGQDAVDPVPGHNLHQHDPAEGPLVLFELILVTLHPALEFGVAAKSETQNLLLWSGLEIRALAVEPL